MLPLRYAGFWQTASLAGLAVVFAGTLVPPDWLWPDDPSSALHVSDKWLHGCTFAFLAVWFSGQYARRSYWRIAVGLLSFGALIEICQYALAYRSAELLDMLANATGLTAGLLLALAGAGGWSLRFERWLRSKIE